MNTTELKAAWQLYGNKLQTSQAINEKIIVSMIRERSNSRITRIKRENVALLGWMTILLGLFIAALFGNPFDFRYPVQYVPSVIFIIVITGAIISLIKSNRRMNVKLNAGNLENFLNEITEQYRKAYLFKGWQLALMMLSAAMLFSLSFLPVKIEKHGWWPAMRDTVISWMIGAGIYILALKLGVFKDRHGARFSEDLKELQELKAMTAELTEEPI